jgi:hypothetical protein
MNTCLVRTGFGIFEEERLTPAGLGESRVFDNGLDAVVWLTEEASGTA